MGENEIAKAMIAGLPPLVAPADAPVVQPAQAAAAMVLRQDERHRRRQTDDVSPADSAGPTGSMP